MAEITFGKLYIHRNYLDSRRSLPRLPFQRPFSENDIHFQPLKENRNIPDPKQQRDHLWISLPTWNLIDKCAFAVQWRQPLETIHSLSKAIRQSLRKDLC
jgi:hypothetical protein